MTLALFEERTEGVSLGGVTQSQSHVQRPALSRVRGASVGFGYGRAHTGMNRLPNRQIDVDDPPRLGRIPCPRDGHVKTLTARMGGDEAKLPQEFLQVAHKAWCIDDDVQAAVTLRSCRNGVAFSHCREKTERVKGRWGSDHQTDRHRPLGSAFGRLTSMSTRSSRATAAEGLRAWLWPRL